jgi:hypothetical protein
MFEFFKFFNSRISNSNRQCKSKNINETVFVSSLVVALRSSAPEAVDVNTAFAFASTAGGSVGNEEGESLLNPLGSPDRMRHGLFLHL